MQLAHAERVELQEHHTIIGHDRGRSFAEREKGLFRKFDRTSEQPGESGGGACDVAPEAIEGESVAQPRMPRECPS